MLYTEAKQRKTILGGISFDSGWQPKGRKHLPPHLERRMLVRLGFFFFFFCHPKSLAFAGTKISLSTPWQPFFLKSWFTGDKTSLYGKHEAQGGWADRGQLVPSELLTQNAAQRGGVP